MCYLSLLEEPHEGESPNLQSNLAYAGSSENMLHIIPIPHEIPKMEMLPNIILSPHVFQRKKGIIKLTEAQVSSSGKEHQFVFIAQKSPPTRAAT